MQKNPYLAILIGFISVIAVGTVILSLPWSAVGGQPLPLLDALFTATSATCVTGLSVLDIGRALSPLGQATIAVMMQVGGLGLMTLSTFFGLLLGVNPRLRDRLALREALNQVEEFSIPHLIGSIILFTFAMEFTGALFLMMGPGDSGLPRALFHSISAFCNAGFTLFPQSLEGFRSSQWVNLVFMVLIVSGGLGFWVVYDLYRHLRSRLGRGTVRPLSLQSRVVLRMSGLFIVVGTLLFLFVESGRSLSGSGYLDKVTTALFQSVTTRTAGFNTVDIGSLALPTILWMMIWMFVGASPGSTGGGIKTTTFAVLVANLRSVLAGKERTEIGGNTLPETVVTRANAIFFLSVAWVLVATFLMVLFGTTGGGGRFAAVIFETVSAFGTVGLSMGMTDSLTAAGKVIIILTMFAGRVGPLSLILALARKPSPPKVVFPEQGLPIG
ncbi:MAG: TrkH family potassium uptake protein [bacterium]|nr:TrkH family potassium uptake protein [bacterium]MDT8396013.1 TrkH family potassium uptake protein [bacterium]